MISCLSASPPVGLGPIARITVSNTFAWFIWFNDSRSFSHQCALSNFRPVSLSYISELLSKLTIKSCPLDPFPASVLKQCIPVLLPVMSSINC